VRSVAIALLVGCGDDAPAPAIDMSAIDMPALDQNGPSRCTRCMSPRTAVSRGPGPAILGEASGLAASQLDPGVLYAHNDSGDAARIFALDADTGGLLATITLAGAAHVDYEDLAVAPCAVGSNVSCVYVGDIGDNGLARDTKTIYVFPEPVLAPAISVAVEPITFAYPDGRHNAETLIVHPVTGAIYIVTKEAPGVASSVYRVDTTPATRVTTLPFPTGTQLDVSGGDIDACGDTILLRLGSSALYALDGGTFTGTPRSLPIVQEANGEAIAWNLAGTGYFTISEGAGAALNFVDCP